jgi:uncharacterized protein YbjQ (UPF0145 family)
VRIVSHREYVNAAAYYLGASPAQPASRYSASSRARRSWAPTCSATFFAGIRDIVGGRSACYEGAQQGAPDRADRDGAEAARLGANAVLGVDLDYETIGTGNGAMLMVTTSGTVVDVGA